MSAVPKPRQAVLRKICDPLTKDPIDHGLILWFPGTGHKNWCMTVQELGYRLKTDVV